jgi:predicted O-methyltransferase YrrM
VSLNRTPQTVTADTYRQLFADERLNAYPTVDMVEEKHGFSVDRDRLETAAAVLSCPYKAAPPNWQHGRVIYAVAREYLSRVQLYHDEPVRLLDIGTAKGFSALCLQWALNDSGLAGSVTSVDVLPPGERVRRNTIAEVDGLCTLEEILAPFPEAQAITFVESTGVAHLKSSSDRLHMVFVDGKHTDEAVFHEGKLIAARQAPGDMVVFDDWQVPGVAVAIRRLSGYYDLNVVTAKATRAYVIARRK